MYRGGCCGHTPLYSLEPPLSRRRYRMQSGLWPPGPPPPRSLNTVLGWYWWRLHPEVHQAKQASTQTVILSL